MAKTTNLKQRSATKEDDLKVGTVLFTAGEANHVDMWDDSELIEHWDKTIEIWRNRYSSENHQNDRELKPPLLQTKNSNVSQVCISKNYQASSRSKPVKTSSKLYQTLKLKSIKPEVQPNGFAPPRSNEDDLSNLIMAWYYCGYYTGLYQAKKN